VAAVVSSREPLRESYIQLFRALQPNLVITAEVFREEIETSVNFEVKDKGWISFPNSRIVNMTPRLKINAHFASIDPRIPPYAQYEDADDRPYLSARPINFYLEDGIVVNDQSDCASGRLGGDNGSGIILPAITYGAPPTDTARGKVQGGKLGPIDSDGSDSCPTDSTEDLPNDDAHKLTQIARAIHKDESVTVCLKGHFKGAEDIESVVEFRSDHVGHLRPRSNSSSRQRLTKLQPRLPSTALWGCQALSCGQSSSSLKNP
jgi:hypothetical protein